MFLHVDDVIGIIKGIIKTIEVGKRAREDLRKYGLSVSKEKSV